MTMPTAASTEASVHPHVGPDHEVAVEPLQPAPQSGREGGQTDPVRERVRQTEGRDRDIARHPLDSRDAEHDVRPVEDHGVEGGGPGVLEGVEARACRT